MNRLTASGVLVAVAIAAVAALACGKKAPEYTPSQPVSSTVTPDVAASERGSRLYAQSCQTCHGDREGKGGIPEAPVHNDTGHTWHHPDAQIRDWVQNGKVGFGQMPPQKDKLSSDEMDLILAYIKTWWTPDQRALQEDVSKRYQESLERLK